MRAFAWLLAASACGWLGCSTSSKCGERGASCESEEAPGETGDGGAAASPAGAGGESPAEAGAPAQEGGSRGGGGDASAGAGSDEGAEPGRGGEGGGGEAGAGGDSSACDPKPVVVGTIAGDELDELSGMVASIRNPGVYYVHNDSGDRARFFAIDERGRTLAEIALSGATAIDWEDIALGPGPGGEHFVYLGDVGDNAARVGGTPRSSIDVYRVPEPLILLGDEPAQIEMTDWARLPLSYPDVAHDCEALLLDPESSDLLLVTKENAGNSSVFRASALAAGGAGQTLELVAQLAFGTSATPGSSLVTGGEMSAAGDGLLLRTYTSVFYWQRSPGQTVARALGCNPRELPAPEEKQGESITFSADGLSYLTVSESEHAQVFRAPLSCPGDEDRETLR